jgi:hypothetical protein
VLSGTWKARDFENEEQALRSEKRTLLVVSGFNKHVRRKVEVYCITFKINPKLNRHLQVISRLHCAKWNFV